MGLRLRIFLGMLLVVFLALVSTAVVAYYHAQRTDVAYNEQRLQRKEAALSRSLDYVLARHPGTLSKDSISTVFSDRICELADVHSLVFSLYTLEGSLITTSAEFTDTESQPPIRLTPETTPSAIGELKIVTTENKNGAEVTRVYWVVFNSSDEPLMIASAKYNPRKIDENAIGSFLSRLTPVYTVLFLGTILIAYFTLISITRPLLNLKREMAESDPLADTAMIDYRWHDEIGALVEEYNVLLNKLRSSLEERAKYERAGAWKEMAQQVAHEIKNPLTPLRLGIQQLERAWNDKAPDFPDRLERFSQTAISQIDILSQISQDFVQLADIRKPKLISVSLDEVVGNSAGLFGPEKVMTDDLGYQVIADSSSLVRVFNNLISNAIEASDEAGSNQPVRITARELGDMIEIAISDKGIGIEQAKLDRIFEPRFTTKNHGLGLGLAMVKSIVEQASGKVVAKSIEGEGSTFYVSLPKA